MSGADSDNPHWELFEACGEDRVRDLIETGRMTPPRSTYGLSWLRKKEADRAANPRRSGLRARQRIEIQPVQQLARLGPPL